MGVNRALSRPRVGIVGGTGKMGSWFSALLEGAGSQVWRVGRRTDLVVTEMVQKCDVVVISVPVAATVNVIKEIGPMVSEDKLLMDLTSIKKAPVEAMLKYSRSQVVGVHTLFGPEVALDSDLRVAVVPGRGERGQRWITDILIRAGFDVIVLDAEKHDRMMGLIQGVNHFSTLTFALCISRCGIELEDLMGAATPAFQQRLNRIRSILAQPAGLFGSLLMDNQAAGEYIEHYREAVDGLARITGDLNTEEFGETFAALKKTFKG